MSACFVAKVEPSLAEQMEKDLISQGFSIERKQYTHFVAKKPGLSVAFYQSGKVTIQGKNKDPFIEFYFEPEILKTFNYTHKEAFIEKEARIGSDEAGKGDFFGPLSVASFYANESDIQRLTQYKIQDSKTLKDSDILRLAKILKGEFSHEIIVLYPEKYNELYNKFRNLNSLLAWAHATAITNLSMKTGCTKVIIDQFAHEKVMIEAFSKKDVNFDLTQRFRAEEDIVVAAASILARGAFLDGLKQLEERFNVELRKGASNHVKIAAKKIIKEQGAVLLSKLCKTHFKTHGEILSSPID